MQNLLFPTGLVSDKKNGAFRTFEINFIIAQIARHTGDLALIKKGLSSLFESKSFSAEIEGLSHEPRKQLAVTKFISIDPFVPQVLPLFIAQQLQGSLTCCFMSFGNLKRICGERGIISTSFRQFSMDFVSKPGFSSLFLTYMKQKMPHFRMAFCFCGERGIIS